MRILLLVVVLVAVVLGALIGYHNSQDVSFDYLFGETQIPLFLLLIADFMLGVLVTLAVAAGRILSLRLELRRTRARLRAHETELRNLRGLPSAGEGTSSSSPAA